MALTLRYRDATGVHRLPPLAATATVGDVVAALAAAAGVPAAAVRCKGGFPPAPLDLSDPARPLAALLLKNGDTLVLETVALPAMPAVPPPAAPGPAQAAGSPDGVVVRRVIDDDNSCLFNAIGYVLDKRNRSAAPQLRELVAAAITSDPETYTEAVLGKPNDEYCRWILKPESWGGGIELAILGRMYNCEILAFDIQAMRVNRFGEDANFIHHALVIYDGIHYDALALAPSEDAPEALDQTVFNSTTDTERARLAFVEAMALELTRQANKQHKFTDLAKFSLRCSICHTGLVGQREAQAHAVATGHGAFEEYL